MKSWLALSALLLVTACGSAPYPPSHPTEAAAAPKAPSAPLSDVSEDEGPVPIGAHDAVWGSRFAPVTIVEFADFQCSYCERASETLEKLKAEYGPEKLRIVWKNDPLTFHEDARPLAEAGQGVLSIGGNEAFWKFHRAAYDGMKTRWTPPKKDSEEEAKLTPEVLSSWVQAGGVDGKRVLSGLDKHTWAEKVDRDIDLAHELNVSGTPAFFINGVKLDGARPAAEFRKVIDAETEKAKAKQGAGTVRDRVYLEMTAQNRANAPKDDDEDKYDPTEDKTVYKVAVGKSPALGPADAPVTVVEFSDFECPFCKRAEPTVKALLDKYKGSIRLVWKNNPLPFHKRADPSAELAMEAYAAKGAAGFWAAHDKLFEKSPALEDADLDGIARDLGLNQAKVRAAISTHRYQAGIDADQFLSDDVEASATPAFFINGRKVMGSQPLAVFDKIVGQEMDRAKAEAAKGTPATNVYDALIRDGKVAEPERKTVAAKADAPVRGAAKAKVTIVEFGDFQCPYCERAQETVTQIMKDYQGRVKLVFRNMPLPFHPDARPAAEAALEAYKQKGSAGFFKMHDVLYANRTKLDRASLEAYAQQVGLDGGRFARSLDAHDHNADIDADVGAAKEAGIDGTPAFIINGYLVSGAKPYRAFKRAVERALADASASGRSPGTAAANATGKGR